jgi:hypothetical protein
MLKSKDNAINARIQKNFTDDSVIINAGSLVFDNKWIDYSGTFFNVKSYLRGLITDQRLRFFTNINYAAYLVIGIDVNGSLTVLEGTQVPYTTLKSVPIPPIFDIIPLVGVVVIQDGSSNLIDGIKPLNENNVIFYSGMGNVLDKNQIGQKGVDSNIKGETGIPGETGLIGFPGLTGPIGDMGTTGYDGLGITGQDGAQGITGINWDIQVLFNMMI